MSLSTDLQQFTGSENFYQHSLSRRVVYTDGVKFLAEKAEAYWLIDKIAANCCYNPDLKREEFQVWKLRRNATGTGAKITVEDGNDRVRYSEDIDFTVFPEPAIDLWAVVNETGGYTILLPSEY